MNEFIKKICPFAAIVCFALCMIGAIGVIDNAAGDRLWKSVGLVFIGVSIFVLFALLMLAGLYTGCKEPVKPNGSNARRTPKPAGKPALKGKAVSKASTKSADKTSTKSNDKQESKSEAPASSSQEKIDDTIRRDSGEQIAEDSGPTTLYICNLSTETSELDLREEFEVFGVVKSVRLVTDKETGVSKGYAFVEMANRAEASLAIDDINGQEIKGQQVNVSIARKKPSYNRRWKK